MTYFRGDTGAVHRHDVQWTQPFVVVLPETASITLDAENKEWDLVPLAEGAMERWMESRDLCDATAVGVLRGVGFASEPGEDVLESNLAGLKIRVLKRVRASLRARGMFTSPGVDEDAPQWVPHDDEL